jgi:hypothetical protein
MSSPLPVPKVQSPPWLRATVAGIAGVVSSLMLVVEEADDAPVVLIPAGALLLAAIAVHAGGLGAQLFARAAWWSGFSLGVFLSIVADGREQLEGVWLSTGTAIALLLADPKRLTVATAQGGYRPIAYRGTLQLMMVFAIADALTMSLFGFVSLDKSHESAGLVLLGAAVLFIVGFVGLYRLALWGIFATAGTAFILGVLLATGLVAPDDDLLPPLLFVCIAQPLAVAPMIASMIRKRPLPSLPRVVTTWLERLVIVGGAAAALVSLFLR